MTVTDQIRKMIEDREDQALHCLKMGGAQTGAQVAKGMSLGSGRELASCFLNLTKRGLVTSESTVENGVVKLKYKLTNLGHLRVDNNRLKKNR